MRSLSVLPLAALVVTGSVPPPLLPPAEAKAVAVLDADTICAPFLSESARIHRYAPPVIVGMGMAPPPPPPAPPPPPPPPPAPPEYRQSNEASEILVTGTRIASPQLSSPTPVTVVGSSTVAMIGGSQESRERYAGEEVATVQSVADQPVSTFGVDVDTGSYANVRRMLAAGTMPPQGAVRTEEMLNYFRYDYPRPRDRTKPFSITTDMTRTPWNSETRLLRVGLRGYDVAAEGRPPANLVFLVDVSGSMQDVDKLPLVKCSLALLAERLQPQDRVSIVVYAGAAGQVLAPTSDKSKVIEALSRLEAGGSTAGAAGIRLAYDTARKSMIEGGINRVVLATDGDFNVGVANDEALIDMIERERDSGVTLTALGFGTGNYNESMMEQVADHGNGNYAYVDSPREAQKVLGQELSATLFTIASDVKMQVEFNPAYVAEYRLIGYENRTLAEQDFDNDKVDAGDIGAGHQVTALYELVPAGAKGWLPKRHYEANRRTAAGTADDELAFLRLRYKLPGESQSRLIERPLAASLIGSASAPRGDTAFAAAVAAYGQKLRGDPWLGSFGYADARRLASASVKGDWWRQEFLRLTELAEKPARAAEGSN
jgi:Ca-activated chloride channel family protein